MVIVPLILFTLLLMLFCCELDLEIRKMQIVCFLLFQEADIRKMLNQRINTNNPAADQATIDSLIDDILRHKRQNSEDSGVGEGKYVPNSFLFDGKISIS